MSMKMMMVGVCLAAGLAVAEDVDRSKLSKEERVAEKIRQNGGEVVLHGDASGSVTVVNLQASFAEADIRKAIASIRHNSAFVFEFAKAEPPKEGNECRWGALKASVKAQVLVVIVDDPKMPTLLTAPEDGWAVMNVAKLGEDLTNEKARQKFLPSRARKEFMRAFAFACGAGGSSFKGNILTVDSVRGLDYCREFIPADATRLILSRLEARGIRPETIMTYAQACMAGVAPQPTNDVQKAVWERVRSEKERGPANAIKIAPPKK